MCAIINVFVLYPRLFALMFSYLQTFALFRFRSVSARLHIRFTFLKTTAKTVNENQ